tara:strand:+ start:2483 stop:2713 length:231 start_codon:yes stop_codon:yes gene_type:complete
MAENNTNKGMMNVKAAILNIINKTMDIITNDNLNVIDFQSVGLLFKLITCKDEFMTYTDIIIIRENAIENIDQIEF